MTFSLFGDKFTRHSGITLLMEDLNDGLRTPGAIMLGGGNPAQIPEMQDYFQTLLTDMLESGKATDALCNYDGPQGKTELLTLLAGMLREKLGWDRKHLGWGQMPLAQSLILNIQRNWEGHP